MGIRYYDRRRNSRNMLKELQDRSPLPWCIIGDFDDLLSQKDKSGHHPHPNVLCKGFKEAMTVCDLKDV